MRDLRSILGILSFAAFLPAIFSRPKFRTQCRVANRPAMLHQAWFSELEMHSWSAGDLTGERLDSFLGCRLHAVRSGCSLSGCLVEL